MKPTIVYPTDFSECAENALQFLIPIAKLLDAQIRLVHGIGSPAVSIPEMTPLNVFERLESEKQQAEERLKDIIKTLNEHELENSSEVIQGMVAQTLSEYIEKLQPELVVMGTVGSNIVENKLMGSLTYKLIKTTSCPVLAIPSEVTYNGFEKAVYATNFLSDDFQNIVFLQKTLNSPINSTDIVHVALSESLTSQQQDQLNDMEERLKQSDYPIDFNFTLLKSNEVADSLWEYIEQKQPDVLALSNSNRKFWDRLLNKSLTKKMINQANIPMLVFTASSA